MSIKSKIQALITAANTKTGESDSSLTDAIQTLVDGYGQGGGGEILAGINDIVLGGSAIGIGTADIENNQLTVNLAGKNVSLSGRMFGDIPFAHSGLDVVIICDKLTVANYPFQLSSSSANGGSVTFRVNQDYLAFSGQHFTGGTGNTRQFYRFYGLPIYISFAASNNYGGFSRANIEHMDFWENVATSIMYFGISNSMDTSTCVSLANALKVAPEGSTYTVTYASAPKARLSTIMGEIESVTRGEDESLETYDRFVADDNGTVTLMDFITNTKGWTVA